MGWHWDLTCGTDANRRYVTGIGEVRRLEMEQPVIETIFDYEPSRGHAVYAHAIYDLLVYWRG